MVLPAERSLNPSPQAYSRQRMLVALYGCAALLVVVIGVLGLLNAPWPRQILESWINIHALFGMLLCGLVLARCQWHIQYSPPLLAIDIRELSRHLSRTVYVLLYVVIGVRLILGILGNIGHGGVVDFSMIGHFRNGPDSLTLIATMISKDF